LDFKNKVKSSGTIIVEVRNSAKIISGVYSTGELSSLIKEQSLVINTKRT